MCFSAALLYKIELFVCATSLLSPARINITHVDLPRHRQVRIWQIHAPSCPPCVCSSRLNKCDDLYVAQSLSMVFLSASPINPGAVCAPTSLPMMGLTAQSSPSVRLSRSLPSALPTAQAPTSADAEIQERVDSMLEALGLSHVKDTVVGDENLRGVSGGQKRRVTFGEMC